MTDQIKYLSYKGIEKKDQIVFKSFLNLSQNELKFQVEILTPEQEEEGAEPDWVIRDSEYSYSDSEAQLESLPTIVVSSDGSDLPGIHLTRPVQWSDFKSALGQISFDGAEQGGDHEHESVLLTDEFEGMELTDPDSTTTVDSEQIESEERSFSDADDQGYELDQLSVDYHSFTSGEYMQVADEVAGFKENQSADVQESLVLVTDEESASQNSVVIIETNSLDAWEMSESEFGDAESTVDSASTMSISVYDERTREEILKRLDSGKEITLGDEFWKEDQEVFSNKESIMVIKADRETVYSRREPAKWAPIFRHKELTRVPVKADWSPSEKLKAYPISRLIWVNTLVTRVESLNPELVESHEYMLESWPHFELLELDNALLKLCTMLFVAPETAYSLMQKTGYGRHMVFGLMNACYEMGILKPADQIAKSPMAGGSDEGGMLGKIKGVFR